VILEYNTPEVDPIIEAIQQINQSQATWLSRLRNELVVIVRNKENVSPFLYNWVWLSGVTGAGAYLSNTDQTVEQVADTIVRGGWNFQPNLKITLEDII
jgi:phospholipase/lecithinase/hemolysin